MMQSVLVVNCSAHMLSPQLILIIRYCVVQDGNRALLEESLMVSSLEA